MFCCLKTPANKPADSLLKTVSLYLIFAGLLILIVVEMSLGLWGFWYNPLSLRWFIFGVTETAAGCAGLMVYDIRLFLRKMWGKWNDAQTYTVSLRSGTAAGPASVR